MKNKLREQDGMTLIIVIISLTIMMIFGITLLSVTTSNFKMTKIDSRSQSAYYIAESGINYIVDKVEEELKVENKDESKKEFFERIKKVFSDKKSIKSFEENTGEEPHADIKVDIVKKDESSKVYEIISTGVIGNSKRTTNLKLTIGWDSVEGENNSLSDILFNTSKFIFNGSQFNAQGKTIVIGGQDVNSINGGSEINAKNIYFKGLSDGVVSGKTYGDKNNPGDIYLDGDAKILGSGRVMYGNVHTNENFTVTGGVDIYGDLIVKGDLSLGGGSKVHGDVYVSGNLKLTGGAKLLKNVTVLGDIEAGGGSEIHGKLKVDDNADLVSVTLNQGAEIRGNLTLNWTPTFNGDVSYGGSLVRIDNSNNNGIGKIFEKKDISAIDIKKLPSFEFKVPECKAELKSEKWYKDNGYEIKGDMSGKLPKNAKWFVGNYESRDYQNIDDGVVIISKGDIVLRGGNNFSGALIAPNGKVEYLGNGTFNGLIISNNEIKLSGGGTTANIKSLDEYFGASNIPVDYKCDGKGSGNDSNSGSEVSEPQGKGKIINITKIKEQ